ncbi:MAG: protein translocase subunit SecF, partial [Gaiella sp.]
KVLGSPRFVGAAGGGIPRWLKADYIGRRNTWFAISAVVLAISIDAIAVNGLNFGIDFEGGTQITFSTSEPVPLEEVRAQAAEVGQAGAVIQGRGASVDGKYSDFQIRTESISTQEAAKLQQGLESAVGAEAFGAKNVSASFGEQIARSALLAIVVSLLLIVAYISVRFQWKFALPVLIALAHDVIITVGIYALLGREVTTATVAAVLTVLGYSIYDTIIIFDRIRENMPLMKKASFRTIGNVSLWETIPRSLATTFITLLPIASLLVFGGDTLKDFAFALFVGIGSGAYSSIFIAAPLLAIFKQREPEYARRRDDVPASEIQSVGGVLLADVEQPGVDAEPAPAAEEVESGAPVPAPAGAPAATGPPSAGRRRRQERRSGRPHGRPR